jgi:hypothetical protein
VHVFIVEKHRDVKARQQGCWQVVVLADWTVSVKLLFALISFQSDGKTLAEIFFTVNELFRHRRAKPVNVINVCHESIEAVSGLPQRNLD